MNFKKYFLKESKIIETEYKNIFLRYTENIEEEKGVIYHDYDLNFNQNINIINFKNKLELCLMTLFERYNCFDIRNKKTVTIDMILENKFLFYSIKGEIDYREYVFTMKKENFYTFYDEWFAVGIENITDDIFFNNDHDGDGLCFLVDTRSDSYKFLIDIFLNSFCIEANDVSIQEDYMQELKKEFISKLLYVDDNEAISCVLKNRFDGVYAGDKNVLLDMIFTLLEEKMTVFVVGDMKNNEKIFNIYSNQHYATVTKTNSNLISTFLSKNSNHIEILYVFNEKYEPIVLIDNFPEIITINLDNFLELAFKKT